MVSFPPKQATPDYNVPLFNLHVISPTSLETTERITRMAKRFFASRFRTYLQRDAIFKQHTSMAPDRLRVALLPCDLCDVGYALLSGPFFSVRRCATSVRFLCAICYPIGARRFTDNEQYDNRLNGHRRTRHRDTLHGRSTMSLSTLSFPLISTRLDFFCFRHQRNLGTFLCWEYTESWGIFCTHYRFRFTSAAGTRTSRIVSIRKGLTTLAVTLAQLFTEFSLSQGKLKRHNKHERRSVADWLEQLETHSYQKLAVRRPADSGSSEVSSTLPSAVTDVVLVPLVRALVHSPAWQREGKLSLMKRQKSFADTMLMRTACTPVGVSSMLSG